MIPKLQVRKTVKIVKGKEYESKSYYVTINKELIDFLNWQEGDLLIERFSEDKKSILIEKIN